MGVKDHGDAIIVDFGSKRGAIYVLTSTRSRSAVFPAVLTNCFQVDTAGDPEWIAKFQSFATGSTCELEITVLEDKNFTPYIVAFKNERIPKSVIEVESTDFRQTFGKSAYFDKITLERIDNSTPLTKKVVKKLPWLKDIPFEGTSIRSLEAMPNGGFVSAADARLSQKLSDYDFTGTD